MGNASTKKGMIKDTFCICVRGKTRKDPAFLVFITKTSISTEYLPTGNPNIYKSVSKSFGKVYPKENILEWEYTDPTSPIFVRYNDMVLCCRIVPSTIEAYEIEQTPIKCQADVIEQQNIDAVYYAFNARVGLLEQVGFLEFITGVKR